MHPSAATIVDSVPDMSESTHVYPPSPTSQTMVLSMAAPVAADTKDSRIGIERLDLCFLELERTCLVTVGSLRIGRIAAGMVDELSNTRCHYFQ